MTKLALGLAFASLAAAAPAIGADVAFGTPALVNEIVLPTGLAINGVGFGGISGLDYDAKDDLYYAISDDRSEHGDARFYTLKLAIDDKGIHGVDIVSTVTLTGTDGKPFTTKNIDPESIRYDGHTGHVFWSSEGDLQGRPAIYEAATDGTVIRTLSIPDYYMPNADHTSGIVNNLAFENLALSPDGKFLYAGLENGLQQDGGRTTLEAGSLSRILKIDLATGKPVAEYPIEIEKIPNKGTDGKTNDNGMSEFLMLNDHTLLTMERGYALGVGDQIDLYTVDLSGATNVLGKATLKGIDVTSATKTHAMRVRNGEFPDLVVDNLEGLTFGPAMGGKPSLIIESDNNFSPSEVTQFIVFTLDGYKAN